MQNCPDKQYQRPNTPDQDSKVGVTTTTMVIDIETSESGTSINELGGLLARHAHHGWELLDFDFYFLKNSH